MHVKALTVTVTTVAATDELLRDDQLVEGIKLGLFFASDCRAPGDKRWQTNLFRSNETIHKFQTLQVFAWTKDHGKKVKFAGYETCQWARRIR